MSRGQNSPGISRLTDAIIQTAKGAQDVAPAFDFGEITSNHELLCNSFPMAIPKSDYLICRSLSSSGGGSKVKPGDRVLIAWVGNDPVVIDIIMEASSVL